MKRSRTCYNFQTISETHDPKRNRSCSFLETNEQRHKSCPSFDESSSDFPSYKSPLSLHQLEQIAGPCRSEEDETFEFVDLEGPDEWNIANDSKPFHYFESEKLEMIPEPEEENDESDYVLTHDEPDQLVSRADFENLIQLKASADVRHLSPKSVPQAPIIMAPSIPKMKPCLYPKLNTQPSDYIPVPTPRLKPMRPSPPYHSKKDPRRKTPSKRCKKKGALKSNPFAGSFAQNNKYHETLDMITRLLSFNC